MVRDRLHYHEGTPLTLFAYPAEAGSRVTGKNWFSFLYYRLKHLQVRNVLGSFFFVWRCSVLLLSVQTSTNFGSSCLGMEGECRVTVRLRANRLIRLFVFVEWSLPSFGVRQVRSIDDCMSFQTVCWYFVFSLEEIVSPWGSCSSVLVSLSLKFAGLEIARVILLNICSWSFRCLL
jgi:hypothetical protein